MKTLDQKLIFLIITILLVCVFNILTLVYEANKQQPISLDSNFDGNFLHTSEELENDPNFLNQTEWKISEEFKYINEAELKSLTSKQIEYIKYHKGKRPPSRYTEWISFAKKKKCPKPHEFYQQVYEDLSPFFYIEKGKTISKITKEMMEKILNNKNFDILKIRNYKSQATAEQRYRLEKYLEEFLDFIPKNFNLPFNPYDEDIIIPSDDGNTEKPYRNIKDVLERNECFRNTYNNNQTEMNPGSIAYSHGSFIEPNRFISIPDFLPVWSWGKRDCFKDILFPIPEALSSFNDKVKWINKEPKLIWRGTTTGTSTTRNNNHKLTHRYRLVDWAKNQSEYVFNNLGITLDVGFTEVLHCDAEYCEEAKKTTVMRPFVSIEEQAKSKYFIVVDGNSWALRLPTYLKSNSVVFYNGIFTFWFSRHLKPFVHYVPFKADFSDLTEKLEYAKNHDEEMKKIAENARKFIEEFITPDTVSCYLALLIVEYLELVEHID